MNLRALLRRILSFFSFLRSDDESPPPQESSSPVRSPSPEEPPSAWDPPIQYFPVSMSNRRPGGVDAIVIHAAGLYIADENGRVYWGPDYISLVNASYHDMITPDGDVIRSVPWHERAWHAGTSKLGGRKNVNNFSIGFCLLIDHQDEGPGWNNFVKALRDPRYYTDAHYKSLARLCTLAMRDYPAIRMDRIVGHSRISGKDVRPDPKPDPGEGFDMNRLKEMIKNAENQTIA